MELKTTPETLLSRLMGSTGIRMMGSMKNMIQADVDQLKEACQHAAGH